MTLEACRRDERGSALVEFGLTAPVFFLLTLGAIQAGFWLWTTFALQTGAEMAARCASVNPAVCGTPSAVQAYAAEHAFGVPVPASAFTLSQASCGNQVSANYSFLNFATRWGLPAIVINARACYPR